MVVGLTGRYCAGKDTVARLFAARGYRVVDVDALGHASVDRQGRGGCGRVRSFGPAARRDRGQARAGAGWSSADPRALARLEEIVHPVMVERVKAFILDDPGDVLINAAILHRMGLDALCGAVVYVTAPLLLRLCQGGAPGRNHRPRGPGAHFLARGRRPSIEWPGGRYLYCTKPGNCAFPGAPRRTDPAADEGQGRVMDRQKIFWVVLSVSVFVVVVLVVGVLLLRQNPAALAAAPATVSPLSDPGTQVYEYSREAPASDGTETMRFVIGDEEHLEGEAPPPGAAVARRAGRPLGCRAGREERSSPRNPRSPRRSPLPRRAPSRRRPPARAPSTGSRPARTRARRRPRSWPPSWGARASREGFSRTPPGKESYFRVRIGPYTNKGEAEKFLSTVKQIQGLESSYISMVGGAKRAN